ncbi:MAG TPA: hypothetical protein VF586_18430 [Pyrinomonadaceae bacterium]|jgi:hypothetical protein
MRRTFSAAALVLAFCCTVSAGVIHNPLPAPTPAQEGAVVEMSDLETPGGETAEPGWSDSLTGLALDLLAVLPLF